MKVGLAFPDASGAHIGLWHVRTEGSVAKSTIDEADVVDALGSSQHSAVVYIDGATKEVTRSELPGHRLLASPLHRLTLKEKEYKIATVAQLHPLPSSSAQIACLGLLDKHTGLAAISSIKISDNSSTLKRSTSSSLIRASSTSSLSTPFPRPGGQSHLTFLFHCLVHRTASTIAPSASPTSTTTGTRTIRGELRSLGRDLLRRPFSTFTGEVSAVISFTWAVWLWVGSRLLSGRRERSRIVAAPEQSKEAAPVVSPQLRQHLRIELAFVSSRLGFYVKGDEKLKFRLDGKDVAERFVSAVSADGVVEVDVEGAWRSEGAQKEGDHWLLEVSV